MGGDIHSAYIDRTERRTRVPNLAERGGGRDPPGSGPEVGFSHIAYSPSHRTVPKALTSDLEVGPSEEM
jgi:hypothetical protein